MQKFTKYPRKYNKYISASVYDVLDEDYDIQLETARQTSDVRILRRLANSHYWRVQVSVACNEATPADVLDKLADVRIEDVNEAVALNENTAPETLNKLSKVYSDVVKRAVAQNPNTPPEALYELFQYRLDQVVRSNAFANLTSRNIPIEPMVNRMRGN